MQMDRETIDNHQNKSIKILCENLNRFFDHQYNSLMKLELRTLKLQLEMMDSRRVRNLCAENTGT